MILPAQESAECCQDAGVCCFKSVTANILSSHFSPGPGPLTVHFAGMPVHYLDLQKQNSGAILEMVHFRSLQRTEAGLDLAQLDFCYHGQFSVTQTTIWQ